MGRVADVAVIAAAILSAPGWARAGITMPKSDLRELAALALAQAIVERAQCPVEGECEAY